MQRETVINHLLYVPFNHDYTVDDKIKNVLTENEFFEHCFFMPDFQKEINEILTSSSKEIAAFEIDLSKDELVTKYVKCMNEKNALYDWINTNQNDLYCIKGDAGTGKSTFLHYLKNKYPNKEKKKIEWEIIDVLQAKDFVSVLYYRINIPDFGNLYYKTIASILECIIKDTFCHKGSEKMDFEISSKRVDYLKRKYNLLFDGFLPSEEVNDFFTKVLITNKKGYKEKCVEYARNIKKFFEYLFRAYKFKEGELFSVCIELYICLLRCKNDQVRYIIAFDNFERFIGTDEIYSSHLTQFVDKLRKTQNDISGNKAFLAPYYQFIIFMRNTSARMFTSQQVAEIFSHSVDISDWFQVSKILKKKIEWYESKSIMINESERMLDILNDIGFYGGKFRGLRSKLNMLFNNNKRVIVRFLTKILYNPLNQDYLSVYDAFKANKMNIAADLSRFSTRMIVFRLILNELREDGFFKHIVAEKNSNEKTSLGYARKILTILYNYRIQNNDNYMNFADIISELFINSEDYFDKNNYDRRNVIAEVLYYLNYYDGRKDNWLQFIDIQYNVSQNANIIIKDHSELRNLIDKKNKDISIRITSAGIAYLYFVVYTFEFFSCKSVKGQLKMEKFGDKDIPPIFCVIPSAEDIKNSAIKDLACIKILDIVSTEAQNCINEMNGDPNSIPFQQKCDDEPIQHSQRIINSHTGFIGNYIYCLRSIYHNEVEKDKDMSKKLDELIAYIESIRCLY